MALKKAEVLAHGVYKEISEYTQKVYENSAHTHIKRALNHHRNKKDRIWSAYSTKHAIPYKQKVNTFDLFFIHVNIPSENLFYTPEFLVGQSTDPSFGDVKDVNVYKKLYEQIYIANEPSVGQWGTIMWEKSIPKNGYWRIECTMRVLDVFEGSKLVTLFKKDIPFHEHFVIEFPNFLDYL